MKKMLVLFLSLFFCSNLFADSFTQIVFFGDSLSDDGNLHRIIESIPPSPPYFNGRFSNGYTWAEVVGKYYYDKNYMGFMNFAFGGASTYLHTKTSSLPITLNDELIDYYVHSIHADKTKTLFVIWIGANDYLDDKTTDVDTLTTNVVNQISLAITSLINHGAKHFMVLNLPDLSRSPYAHIYQLTDRFHQISVAHQQKLANLIQNYFQPKYPTIQFLPVDIFSIFNDLLDNTDFYNKKYGQSITNTTESCYISQALANNSALDKSNLKLTLEKSFINSADSEAKANFVLNSSALMQTLQLANSAAVPCSDPNSHVFWDPLHPTAAVHEILADIIEEKLANTGKV